MSFNEHIPDRVLEYSDPKKFIGVLDELYKFKQDKMFTALRHTNPILLTDKKWLIKKLSDYGVDFIPMEFPLEIIQQFLLNADVILGTRGSKKGFGLFLSAMTLGRVTFLDYSNFYAEPNILILNSRVQGNITGDNSSSNFYLVDDNSKINGSVSLTATIRSFYFSDETTKALIMDTIEKSYPMFLGFSPNRQVTFNTSTASQPYFHSLLNRFFI